MKVKLVTFEKASHALKKYRTDLKDDKLEEGVI